MRLKAIQHHISRNIFLKSCLKIADCGPEVFSNRVLLDSGCMFVV